MFFKDVLTIKRLNVSLVQNLLKFIKNPLKKDARESFAGIFLVDLCITIEKSAFLQAAL